MLTLCLRAVLLCCGLHHDAMIGAESHAHFLKNNTTLSDALAADAEAGCGWRGRYSAICLTCLLLFYFIFLKKP